MPANQPTWLVFAPGSFLVMWSTSHAAATFALGYSEPITILVLRFTCIVVIMASLFVVLRPPLAKSHANWMHLAIVDFMLQSMYFGMCYISFNAGRKRTLEC